MFLDLRNEPDTGSIESRADFDIIRYANCWEDADVLRRALDVGPGDRVLSVASAGDNSLELLATGAEVVAVDLSRPQLACLDLRAAAFRRLDYPDLLAMLGVRDGDDRLATYRRLRDDLAPESAQFWDAHTELVEEGIIFGGKFERYFASFRNRVLPLIHSRATVDRLLEEKSPQERRRFYDEVWNSRRWRYLFRLFFSRRVMGWLGRDPEFFRYVDGPVSREIAGRTEQALTELSTHDNPYLTFILRGNFYDALPPYLEPEKYEAIRDGLDRLTLCWGTIDDAARHWADGGFDAFNLSDLFEYLDEDATADIYETLLDHARPEARFATWNVFVPRCGHDHHPERLRLLDDLSKTLHGQDRAFFYGNFVVEEVLS